MCPALEDTSLNRQWKDLCSHKIYILVVCVCVCEGVGGRERERMCA